MKKLFYSLSLITAFLLMDVTANAQAFQKGNANLDVGFGFGAYASQATYTFENVPFFGTLILETNDGAASFMMPITFEYGISNKFGIGAQFGFSNYALDDSTEAGGFFGTPTYMVEQTTESVKSIDFAFTFNFHLLNAEKNDLFIGIALGGSKVNWLEKNGTELTGTGGLFKLYLTDRIFFSDNIGILFNIGYTGYTYGDITSSNNVDLANLKWRLAGLNLGTGLAVKF